eukprot:Amastigsp_a342064_59.p2 type:complete len:132 gc:universal Amastigsp_a342064_59:750-355(-)
MRFVRRSVEKKRGPARAVYTMGQPRPKSELSGSKGRVKGGRHWASSAVSRRSGPDQSREASIPTRERFRAPNAWKKCPVADLLGPRTGVTLQQSSRLSNLRDGRALETETGAKMYSRSEAVPFTTGARRVA